jgi:hypothetical protein
MVLLGASAGIAEAQSMLSGKVLTVDSANIAAAHITLHDSAGNLKAETLTDSAGSFQFRIANTTQPVTMYMSVVRIGFISIERVPVRVGRREDLMVRVHMSPDAVQLAPVTVVARRRYGSAALDDYHDKLDDVKRGVGRALEREVMQRYAGLGLMKALYMVPGVQYDNSASAIPRMRGGCVPLTFLDRAPISPDELVALDPALLEGVLVYVGGLQVPPDFSQLDPGVRCGVILAYTAAPSRNRRTISFLNMMVAVAAFAVVVLIPK